MAASVVASFKTEIGGFYLHPSGSRDLWEDYRYYVTGEVGKEPYIKVCDNEDNVLFECFASEFDNEYKKWDDE